MDNTLLQTSRRSALWFMGQATLLLAGTGAVRAASGSTAAAGQQSYTEPLHPHGTLVEFSQRLASAPRRRGFQNVPFAVSSPELWDHEAAAEVLGYKYRSLQVWVCKYGSVRRLLRRGST